MFDINTMDVDESEGQIMSVAVVMSPETLAYVYEFLHCSVMVRSLPNKQIDRKVASTGRALQKQCKEFLKKNNIVMVRDVLKNPPKK